MPPDQQGCSQCGQPFADFPGTEDSAADPIVAVGGRVFGRTGGAEGDAWVLTVQVADLKTGELLWKRVIQKIRAAEEK